jgi:hypothetical protein
MTLTTLVIGDRASARETAIAAAIDPHLVTALILEGLPDGTTALDAFTDISKLQITRIAPGCLCCTGNLTMRVTLNRLLRHRPARLYISLAAATHLDQLRRFLTDAPYDAWLTLTDDLRV